MKSQKNAAKSKGGCWRLLKKLWQCIWNSGGSISNCPGRQKSAQDIRDEWLEKCPWRDNEL